MTQPAAKPEPATGAGPGPAPGPAPDAPPQTVVDLAKQANEKAAEQMKKAFPDKEWTEVPADHPIFNGVFKLDKTKLQTPNVQTGTDSEYTGITWEREDAKEVHFRALYDDKGRMIALACHNTDNGDGWEREGDNIYFFREFAEKKNYPLAINILFYTMTH